MQVYGLMTEFLKKAHDKNRNFVKSSKFYTLYPIRYRKDTQKIFKKVHEGKTEKSKNWREPMVNKCSSISTVDPICEKMNVEKETKVFFNQ